MKFELGKVYVCETTGRLAIAAVVVQLGNTRLIAPDGHDWWGVVDAHNRRWRLATWQECQGVEWAPHLNPTLPKKPKPLVRTEFNGDVWQVVIGAIVVRHFMGLGREYEARKRVAEIRADILSGDYLLPGEEEDDE